MTISLLYFQHVKHFHNLITALYEYFFANLILRYFIIINTIVQDSSSIVVEYVISKLKISSINEYVPKLVGRPLINSTML